MFAISKLARVFIVLLNLHLQLVRNIRLKRVLDAFS